MEHRTNTARRQHRPRVIPVLLLQGDGLLYKTQKFKDPKYVGDPRIAVKIFNDKCADELAILDIKASIEGRKPNFTLIEEIVSEAFMPIAYGGGVKTLDDAKTLFSIGVEKIILNAAALETPELITAISEHGGTQSVLISIDAKKSMFGGWQAYTHSGRKKAGIHPVELAKAVERLGAGEIMINAIDRDGMMNGYDVELCAMVSKAVSIPVIACGGAGTIGDCADIISASGVSAAAAGSIFVFQGPHRAVLIKFPTDQELQKVFSV